MEMTGRPVLIGVASRERFGLNPYGATFLSLCANLEIGKQRRGFFTRTQISPAAGTARASDQAGKPRRAGGLERVMNLLEHQLRKDRLNVGRRFFFEFLDVVQDRRVF